jgi:hypothetical protein
LVISPGYVTLDETLFRARATGEGIINMRRRYAVKMVTMGSPGGWSGTLWAVGCKRLSSAEALFVRKAAEVGSGDGFLLIDREQKKVLRSVGSSDPKKTAAWFRW